MGKYLQKQSSAPENGAPVASVVDIKFEKDYPALWEFLTLDRWEDGSQRVPGTFLAFREDGRWKGCLNDRDASRSTFITSATFAGLLTDCEDGLADGTHEWRGKKTQFRGSQKKTP
jgi:hypothetical protein